MLLDRVPVCRSRNHDLRTPDGRGQLQGKVVIDLRAGDAWACRQFHFAAMRK
jgi:hypothetical protein